MFGYIYETTNLIDGKKYIGKHKSKEFDKNYYGSGTSLKKALEKYGKENFSIKIIEEISDDKDYKYLSERERSWIEVTNAVKNDKYYNNSYGGENEGWSGVNKAFKETNNYPTKFKGKHHSIETKIKLSNALKGRTSANKGKHLSKETKIKLSNSLKGRVTWNKGLTKDCDNRIKSMSSKNKGKHHSKETKAKISKSCKGLCKNYIWLTNGKDNKFIPSKDKDKYLNLEYYPGMTKHKVTLTDKMYAHVSTIAKGRKHINKNGMNKMCKLEDLNYYLNNGWKLGRK